MTFAFELLLSWNVAFVVTHNLRKRIVLKRSKIAQFYVWHSTFIFDFISTMVFIVQVRTGTLQTGWTTAYIFCSESCIYQRLLVLTLACMCCMCPCAFDTTKCGCNLSLTATHHLYSQHFAAWHCQANEHFIQLIWLYTA